MLKEKYAKKCEFNIDTGCVEIEFSDSSKISIDCTAVENEFAETRYETSELDYLIYNDPVSYANLILSGGIKDYLSKVTCYYSTDFIN